MSDPEFYIETPRLYLSHFIPSNPTHCAFLVELYNTPLFIAGEGKTSIVTAERARERIETEFIPRHQKNKYGTLLLSLKPTEQEEKEKGGKGLAVASPVGLVSLTKGDSPESFSRPDIGFALLPSATGKGYATEGAKAVLEYVKETLGLAEYFGFTDPGNVGSVKVLERLGMENRGMRKLKPFGGHEGLVFVAPGMTGSLADYGVE